jgi:hypothetical protein
VEVSLNPRGPSRKAKYSLATDSEPSSASERWEEPLQGEDSEPETTCLQAVGGRLVSLPPWKEIGPIGPISPIGSGPSFHGGGLTKPDGVPFA